MTRRIRHLRARGSPEELFKRCSGSPFMPTSLRGAPKGRYAFLEDWIAASGSTAWDTATQLVAANFSRSCTGP